jgi:tryptophan synthase alpha chain
MTRIHSRFEQLRRDGRKGFIAYITAGDPSLGATEDVVLRLEDAGADIVELGIPFSDPLADGRVNQESAARALAAGTTIHGVFDCVARIRRRSQLPLMCYAYANPIYSLGPERIVREAARAGVDGMLILDLPVEEAGGTERILRAHGLDNICLVTPTTPDARIAKIVRHATGFVYCVSREGVTGAQRKLSVGAAELIAGTKRHTRLPVAIGFGIGTPAQAREAARVADAVVVGSAIVEKFYNTPRADAAKWVKTLVKAVKEVHGVRHG